MFKPVYYLGCKASIGTQVRDAIESVAGNGRACDLFAGSGAVAAALCASRDVTAVDIQEYSRVLCEAQLNPAELSPQDLKEIEKGASSSAIAEQLNYCLEPLVKFEHEALAEAGDSSPELLVSLIESHPLLLSPSDAGRSKLATSRRVARERLQSLGLWNARDTTITRYYGGVYFSFDQAIYLDAALSLAGGYRKQKRDTIKASVLSVASSLVNTVGKQFAQPIRPRDKTGKIKSALVSAAVRDRTLDAAGAHRDWLGEYAAIPRSSGSHEAVRGDYLEVLSKRGGDFSVVYADPPYTRDHYSRFYHVLETMCLRDEPDVSTVSRNGEIVPSRGVYREGRHQSSFCVRSTAPKAFDALFSEAKKYSLPLVLSYSPSEDGDGTHPRVVSSSQIVELAKRSYRNVEVRFLEGKNHNQHNRSDLGLAKRLHAEMLLLCTP